MIVKNCNLSFNFPYLNLIKSYFLAQYRKRAFSFQLWLLHSMCTTLTIKILVESGFHVLFFFFFFLVKHFVYTFCVGLLYWLILQTFAYQHEQKVSPSKLSVLSQSLSLQKLGARDVVVQSIYTVSLIKVMRLVYWPTLMWNNPIHCALLHHPSKCQLLKRVNSSPTLPLVVRDLLFM